jgi:long-chain acyl-CoA synthetase
MQVQAASRTSATTSVTGPPLDARIVSLSGESLVELLDLAATRTPGSIALSIRRGMLDERWTYRQVAECSVRVAQRLRAAGVGRGDRVLTWSQNDPWLVVAYFAVWRLGAVIVPLDLRMQTDVALRIGARARPSILLTGRDVDPRAATALAVPVIEVDAQGLDPAGGCGRPARLAEGGGKAGGLAEGPAPAPAEVRELASADAREATPADAWAAPAPADAREATPADAWAAPAPAEASGSTPADASAALGVTVGPDDIAEILFTSGTTSDPKGVVLTHGQILHTARAFAQTGMGRRPDRGLAIIPLSHMYAQSLPLLMGFMGGSTLVFLHALTPKAISTTMQRERITAVTLAPQLISIVLQGIEAEARRTGGWARLERARRLARWLPFRLRRLLFRSVLDALGGALEVITSGGAMLGTDLQRAWETFGVRVIQGYGTTECAAICGHSRVRQRAGTVGPPLARIEVRIGPDGELLARGPNVMLGYWEDPDATAEVLDADGWFHTGDAATIDASGEVVILGRTRDRISLPNGLNVYPEDVEAALLATGQLKSAVVFEPSPGRLAAVVLPTDAGVDDALLDASVRRANATLAPHQRVGAWRRWPEVDFPRTHTLKICRQPVMAWYTGATQGRETGPVGQSGEAAAKPAARGGNGATPESLAALVASMLEETRGPGRPDVTPRTELASLQLDSLAAVTLALRIDEAFDASLSDDEILAAHDIEDLCRTVRVRQGQPPAPAAPRWAFSGPARLLRRWLDATLTGWAIRIVARPHVEGLEHLEALQGPVLICPNHTSHLDAPVVRAALPGRLRDRSAIAAAADVWFDGSPLGPLTQLALGAIPFGRSSDVRASLERVGSLVNDGFSVIIFPEGTRSADGRLGAMREGIGLLATSLRIPVVPAYIDGAREILPKEARLPRRRAGSTITVRFGRPIELDPAAGIHEATARVGREIAELGRGGDSGRAP